MECTGQDVLFVVDSVLRVQYIYARNFSNSFEVRVNNLLQTNLKGNTMTIATYRGFKIGKLYRVINDKNSSYYKNGAIVEFLEDDTSDAPWFAYVSGPIGESLRYNPQRRIAIRLDHLVPVKNSNNLKASTNKPLLLLYIQQQYPNDKVLKALVESL